MSGAPPPVRTRKPLSFRSFGLAMLGVGALVVAVAGALYVRFLRYERVAIRHVPPGAVAAMRVDVTQAVLYDPIRRYVLPLLGGVHAPAAEGDARLLAFENRSGLRRSDLREIVAARGLTADDWVVVLNGVFPRDPGGALFVSALSTEAGWAAESDGHALDVATGYVAARADDGAVLLASSRPWLEAARVPSDRGADLGLEANGVGGFALGREALDLVARTPVVLGARDLARLLQETRLVRGTFVLGERIEVDVAFDAADTQVASRAVRQTRDLLDAYARQEASPFGPLIRVGLERGAVGSAAGSDSRLVFVWERIELDRGLSLLTDATRR